MPVPRLLPTALLLAALSAACADDALPVRPADFDRFWARALTRLEPLPPGQLDATAPGEVTFPVTESIRATGYWYPPRDPTAMAVVHVVEGTTPRPERWPRDGRGHLYLAWRRAGSTLADWYVSGLDGAASSGLMASVLTACQAVHLLRTCPELSAPRVGIVGDGYGATMALAAAALLPDRVGFVIAHQPRPVFHRLCDGTLTSCPAVRRLLQDLPRTRAATTLAALAYFDAVHFAALVCGPVLVIAGERDDQAPPQEAWLLYRQLAGPREWRLEPNTRHRSSDSSADFPAVLARMAAVGAPAAAPPDARLMVTSP